MRTEATRAARHELCLAARALVARQYRRRLTLAQVAATLGSSPRQLQRAYAEHAPIGFREDLLERRMQAAAELLVSQPAIATADVGRLVGYGEGPHFARAFRRGFGVSPARFRAQARARAARAASVGGGGVEPQREKRNEDGGHGHGESGRRAGGRPR